MALKLLSHIEATTFIYGIYILYLLTDIGLLPSKPSKIAMKAQHGMTNTTGTPLADGSFYRSLVDKLIYLIITRPNLTYSVHILSQFMASPTSVHWAATLKLVHYIKVIPGQGLLLSVNSPLSLHTDAN